MSMSWYAPRNAFEVTDLVVNGIEGDFHLSAKNIRMSQAGEEWERIGGSILINHCTMGTVYGRADG